MKLTRDVRALLAASGVPVPPPRSKYGNTKVTVNGETFDSRRGRVGTRSLS